MTPCGDAVVIGYRSSCSTAFVYVRSQVVDARLPARSSTRGATLRRNAAHTIDVFATLSWILSRSLQAFRAGNEDFVHYIALALCDLAEQHQLGVSASGASERGRLSGWQEQRAKQLMENSLAQPASAGDLARACGLSVAQFRRAFKSTTGTPPHAWLQGRRVERAKVLLAGGTLPLTEIALQCGFGDQSHFTGVFTKRVGLSPGVWRRLHGSPDPVVDGT